MHLCKNNDELIIRSAIILQCTDCNKMTDKSSKIIAIRRKIAKK